MWNHWMELIKNRNHLMEVFPWLQGRRWTHHRIFRICWWWNWCMWCNWGWWHYDAFTSMVMQFFLPIKKKFLKKIPKFSFGIVCVTLLLVVFYYSETKFQKFFEYLGCTGTNTEKWKPSTSISISFSFLPDKLNIN